MKENKTRELCELYVKEVIQNYNPKFCIKYKKESKLFRLFKPIIKLVNPAFFTNYITTMFGVMWVPDNFFENKSALNALNITAHEGFHEYDKKRLPKFTFELMYLFPQILFIPCVLCAFIFNWWWIIPGLLFLTPLPAYGRYYLEMRAYAMYKIWNKYVWGEENHNRTDRIVIREMTGFQTYWGTWPFKNWVKKDLGKFVDETEKGYSDTIEFLKKHKLVNL